MKIHPLKNGFTAKLDKIAADKSISHRFGVFSMLCADECSANNYLLAEDTLNTLEIVRNLGAFVQRDGDKVRIKAPQKIQSPNKVLDCGNSGTTMRLMMGFLAGVEGFFVLSGDKYLNERPMQRIAEPLRTLGARIYGRLNASKAPLCIEGRGLANFNYASKIASAQVKTAMILAGFRASGESHFSEPSLSRDHSENMLLSMNAPLKLSADRLKISICPLTKPLKALNITIPNDPSSAFYFAVAAAILPNSRVILQNVLLNPTRIEAFAVLEKMGARIKFTPTSNDFEAVGEICVESSNLRAVSVGANIAWLIDEAPALAIAFACARGVSRLVGARELRVKESDRIAAVVKNLQKCGIAARELDDGFEIEGGFEGGLNSSSANFNGVASAENLAFGGGGSANFSEANSNLSNSSGAKNVKNSANSAKNLAKTPATKAINSAQTPKIESFGDHRIAMSFAILGLKCGVEIDDTECINTSFPNFPSILENLGAKIER